MSNLVPTGVNNQSELRDQLDVFLLTLNLPARAQHLLEWMVPDFSQIVCGSGVLFQSNIVVCVDTTILWDFAVITRRPQDNRSVNLALACREGKLGIWYRRSRHEPIIIAHAGMANRQRYALHWPQSGEHLSCDRQAAVEILSIQCANDLNPPNEISE